MPLYGYNYPWSGRLGSIARCCIYCGDDGSSFHLSSRGNCCTKCNRSNQKPIPELLKEFEAEYERLARQWCLEHGLDYEATVKNYFDHLGPTLQERDDPIPNAGLDYSVLLRELNDL